MRCAVEVQYNSPMDATASYDQSSGAVAVNQSSGYAQNFKVISGSATAERSGASRRDASMVQMLNSDMTPCTNGNPAYMNLAQKDGSVQKFSVATGQVESTRTAKGAILSKGSYDSQVQVQKDSMGQISSIQSSRDGMMQFERTATKLTVSHYSKNQMMAQRSRGVTLAAMVPAKSYSYDWNASSKTMSIVNQEAGKDPVHIERKVEDNKVTIIKGLGNDRVVTIYERNFLPGGKWEEIKTVKGINDPEPTSCVRTVKQSTSGGWLTLSETKGYGTSLAQTTTYTYNEQFRVSLELKPDGGYTKYAYDTQGRVVMEASPWADGDYEKVVRTTYADLRFNDYRPASETVFLKDVNGVEMEVRCSSYIYEDSPQINRTITHITAKGMEGTMEKVDEVYGEEAENAYSRGRTRLKKDVDGVEHFYTYENTTANGASWKVTMDTQVNGILIPRQSKRTVEYRAADETVIKEEGYVHTGNAWSLISSVNYEYDEQKRITKTTRGNGRISTTKWGCCGPLEEIDEDGVKLSYGYNSSRQLIEVIRSATETMPETITSYVRNANKDILSMREDIGARSKTKLSSFDILGRLVSQTDEMGRTTRWEYTKDGLCETIIRPTGATDVTESNIDHSLHYRAVSGKRSFTVEYFMDGGSMIQRRRYADGRIPDYEEIGWSGKTLRQYEAAVDSDLEPQLLRSDRYSGKAQIIESTNRGIKTLFEYDEMGNLAREMLPLSEQPTVNNSRIIDYAYAYEQREDGVYRIVTTRNYNDHGDALVGTRSELVSQLSSTLESKIVITDIYGQMATEWVEYNGPAKRIKKKTLPTSNITEEIHVNDGFIVSHKDQTGAITLETKTYKTTSCTVTTTDPRGNLITKEYDLLDRLISQTDGAGGISTIVYDQVTGNPLIETNTKGATTIRKYDECGRIIAIYGTFAPPVCYAYDEDGHMVKQTTFRVPGTTLTEDPSNRTDGDVTLWEYAWQAPYLLKKTYADGHSTTNQYGAMNRLASVTNARGQKTSYTYDAATGQILAISHDDATPNISYTYNHLGWIKTEQDGTGKRTITYDSHGNPDEESTISLETAFTLKRKYDDLGREVGIRLKRNDNSTLLDTSLAYDSVGRIETRGIMNQGMDHHFTYAYVPGTNLLGSITMPQGLVQQISYEEHRNLATRHEYRKTNGDILASCNYHYDSLARVTEQHWQNNNDPVIESEFSFDERNQIIGAIWKGDNYTYAYDNSSNRTSSARGGTTTLYQSNLLNQYSQIQEGIGSSFIPLYDSDGNQTQIKTNTGIWVVEYNVNNRPIRFTNYSSNTVIECTYDDNDRRITKKVMVSGVVRKKERYIYQGFTLIAVVDLLQSSNILFTLLWESTNVGVMQPLAMVKEDSLYTFALDRGKNIRQVIDSSASIVASYEYDPFGSVNATGSLRSPVQWSSEFFDEELEMPAYNYRHYSPVDGRWTTRDPLGEGTVLNLYSFCGNSLLVDILGLFNPICDPTNSIHTGSAAELLKKSKEGCNEVCGPISGPFVFSLFPKDISFPEETSIWDLHKSGVYPIQPAEPKTPTESPFKGSIGISGTTPTLLTGNGTQYGLTGSLNEPFSSSGGFGTPTGSVTAATGTSSNPTGTISATGTGTTSIGSNGTTLTGTGSGSSTFGPNSSSTISVGGSVSAPLGGGFTGTAGINVSGTLNGSGFTGTGTGNVGLSYQPSGSGWGGSIGVTGNVSTGGSQSIGVSGQVGYSIRF